MLISALKNNVYGYWRTRTGVTAEAQLKSVESRYHSSGRGGGSSSTEVSYDYEVGGQRFTGSHVTLFKTTGRYYSPLKRAMDTHQPVRIFIDPNDPRFAVIDREFAWFPLVIALPFSLAWIAAGLFLGWCLLLNFQGKTTPVQNDRTSRAPTSPLNIIPPAC